MASVLISGVQSKLESWSGTLCCVLGKDGLFSQSLSLCLGAHKWVPAVGNLAMDSLASHQGGT